MAEEFDNLNTALSQVTAQLREADDPIERMTLLRTLRILLLQADARARELEPVLPVQALIAGD